MAIFIVTFRETLEAAIIIGLIFSMLKVFWVEKKRKRYITIGIITGIIMSFLFAGGFQYFFWGFTGTTEKVYEGILMLVACAMITQFLIWTNSNFRNIWKKIKKTVQHIVTTNQLWMLSILAFASVVREWVETVIFLNALDFSFEGSDIWLALWWIITAIALSYILYFTIQKVNISKVLRVTNVMFILIAAWLLAHWIVEFQWAGVLPTILKPLFDLSWILSESEWFWAILKAGLSYDANPSLIAFAAWLLYISGFTWYFYRKKKINC
jgi:high-affinity iron transporter